MNVGIERINVYGGQVYVDVRSLFEARGLDLARFDNLMMLQKAVGLPCEDNVTHAVNAARPLLAQCSDDERNRIELVISATESGSDFAKSMSTHVHRHLGLSRKCRLFEVKQACYGGTAALQMAASWVKSQAAPGAKALVLAADVIMAAFSEGDDGASKFSYAEPSAGVAGVAMLVGDEPHVMALDFGANGYHSYEVNDVCRPSIRGDAGDPDLSLLSYLDCVEGSLKAYFERVDGADLAKTFDYLVYHTPFAGMVKGAHRKAMRTFTQARSTEIDEDFERRVLPSLRYGMQIGGVYSASLYLALCSLLDNAPRLTSPKRVGFFSYGSGCASEFYSGVVGPESQSIVGALGIGRALESRHALSMAEYDALFRESQNWPFGVNNRRVDWRAFEAIYQRQMRGKGYLVFKGVSNYERQYEWS